MSQLFDGENFFPCEGAKFEWSSGLNGVLMQLSWCATNFHFYLHCHFCSSSCTKSSWSLQCDVMTEGKNKASLLHCLVLHADCTLVPYGLNSMAMQIESKWRLSKASSYHLIPTMLPLPWDKQGICKIICAFWMRVNILPIHQGCIFLWIVGSSSQPTLDKKVAFAWQISLPLVLNFSLNPAMKLFETTRKQ